MNKMCLSMDCNSSENTEFISLLVLKPIGQVPRSDSQWCLQVLNDFHLYHEVPLETPFCARVLYAFGLEAVFFLFLQPMPCFRHSFEPGASLVLIIGHCVPRLNVPRLIGIAVFDDKTVSRSFFFYLLERLCGQIFVHITKKAPFLNVFAPVLFNLPGKFCNQGFIPVRKLGLYAPFQQVNPLGWHYFGFCNIMYRVKRIKSFHPTCGFGVPIFLGLLWPILPILPDQEHWSRTV